MTFNYLLIFGFTVGVVLCLEGLPVVSPNNDRKGIHVYGIASSDHTSVLVNHPGTPSVTVYTKGNNDQWSSASISSCNKPTLHNCWFQAAISMDGSTIAVTTLHRKVSPERICRIYVKSDSEWKLKHTITKYLPGGVPILSADGSLLLTEINTDIRSHSTKGLILLRIDEAEPVPLFNISSNVVSKGISQDGSVLFYTTYSNGPHTWVHSGDDYSIIQKFQDAVGWSIASKDKSRYFITYQTAYGYEGLKMYSADDDQDFTPLQAKFEEHIIAAHLSPDGQYLVTFMNDTSSPRWVVHKRLIDSFGYQVFTKTIPLPLEGRPNSMQDINVGFAFNKAGQHLFMISCPYGPLARIPHISEKRCPIYDLDRCGGLGDCSGHGKCQTLAALMDWSCNCDEGYGGPFCDKCSTRHYGPACKKPVRCNINSGHCEEGCHGSMGNGQCSSCHPGYYGSGCEKVVECDQNKGICKDGSCSGVKGNGKCSKCHSGHFGSYCNRDGRHYSVVVIFLEVSFIGLLGLLAAFAIKRWKTRDYQPVPDKDFGVMVPPPWSPDLF